MGQNCVRTKEASTGPSESAMVAGARVASDVAAITPAEPPMAGRGKAAEAEAAGGKYTRTSPRARCAAAR